MRAIAGDDAMRAATTRKGPNPFRAGGFVGTILVLAVSSVAAVVTLFM